MAYRPLVENDRVKIMSKTYAARGTFGTVEAVTETDAKVKMGQSSCWFLQKDLMVAHDALHGFYTSRVHYDDFTKYKKSEMFISVDDEDECPYIDWSHEDLVDRIKELQSQLDLIEGNC